MRYTLLLLLLTSIVFAPSALAAGDAVADERVEQGDGFTLSPAYPNPFNPRTSFSLTVQERQDVTVEVYNLLGVRVKQLFHGVMEAEETRSFTFTAEDLPSGIYLYRVKGETFTATRQMTLLK